MSEQRWDDTQRQAHRIVLACSLRQGAEDDLRQTRLVARALRTEIDPEWIEYLLRAGQEKQLADQVRLRLH